MVKKFKELVEETKNLNNDKGIASTGMVNLHRHLQISMSIIEDLFECNIQDLIGDRISFKDILDVYDTLVREEAAVAYFVNYKNLKKGGESAVPNADDIAKYFSGFKPKGDN